MDVPASTNAATNAAEAPAAADVEAQTSPAACSPPGGPSTHIEGLKLPSIAEIPKDITIQRVVILDWDDTLLCSSHLQNHAMHLDNKLLDPHIALPDDASDEQRKLHALSQDLHYLENCVLELFHINSNAVEPATEFAENADQSDEDLKGKSRNNRTDVFIVTNAATGWVELSSRTFMPRVHAFLARGNHNVRVISARSRFESQFPGEPLKWKYCLIHELLVHSGFLCPSDAPRAHIQKHVISVGDSLVEREATLGVCRNSPNTFAKSVKMSERPTCEQVRRQLELLLQCWNHIVAESANLDYQLRVIPDEGEQVQEPNPITEPEIAAAVALATAASSIAAAEAEPEAEANQDQPPASRRRKRALKEDASEEDDDEDEPSCKRSKPSSKDSKSSRKGSKPSRKH